MTDVVVGVGNPTMSDDGLGHRVVDALEADDRLPASIALERTATSAFLALEALSGAERGIVIDAIETGEGNPGTLYQYRFEDGIATGETPDVLMHDLSFSDALRAGRGAYDIPPTLIVVGVEPADLSVGLEVSQPVAAAIPRVVSTVLEILDEPAGASESAGITTNSSPE